MSSTDLAKCRYRLDTKTSATHILPDGRKLGYAEYGAPTGHPIFFLHGFPGSRLEGAFLDQTASKLNARIISVDRPGFGWSSPHENRTLLSHAGDIEILATHLRLEKYGVLGVSGGGPYALACARVIPPDKLRAVSIVCGLGPPDMGYRGMKFLNYLGWTYGQRLTPSLCRWWFSREPAARLDLSDEERARRIREQLEKDKLKMHPKDVATLFDDQDWIPLHLRSSREAFGQGMAAFSMDFKLLNSGFGFKIEDIRKNLPVHLLYAGLDENVPLHHGQMLAERLGGNARLTIKRDDTHASIFASWQEKYLGDLLKAIEE